MEPVTALFLSDSCSGTRTKLPADKALPWAAEASPALTGVLALQDPLVISALPKVATELAASQGGSHFDF